MSRKKKPILFEDLSAMSDKWTSSITGRGFEQNYMTLLDLISKANKHDQHPNNVKAPGPDIYGSQMFVEMLGEIIFNADEFHKACKQVADSPVIKDNPEAKAQLNKMLKKVKTVKRLILSIGEDIDSFGVDVSDK
jgi:hypothetical protein